MNPDTSRPAPSRSTLALCVAVLCLAWGSTWIVISKGLEDLPPFTSVSVRFALAASVMALLARRLGQREGGERPPRKLVLAMGCLNFGCSYGIVYWSQQHLPSGLVSLLWAVSAPGYNGVLRRARDSGLRRLARRPEVMTRFLRELIEQGKPGFRARAAVWLA